mmetsp:Transcript_1526/g.4059  ORF Transcript_1526/g.4059 Transcript_1526/m.4059 type:complete len:221 (-) Transcript_1526:1097-1759(-)
MGKGSGDASGAAPAEEEDLSSVMFIDKTWLSCFPLNQHTALDYFSLSPFYSRDSNNELVRQQRLELSVLATLTGVEYAVVVNSEPHLFVIQKSMRQSSAVTIPLESYYIVNGQVYQAPSAAAVLSARLVHSIAHVHNALSSLHSSAVVRDDGTYSWRWAQSEGRHRSQPRTSSWDMDSDAASMHADVARQPHKVLLGLQARNHTMRSASSKKTGPVDADR